RQARAVAPRRRAAVGVATRRRTGDARPGVGRLFSLRRRAARQELGAERAAHAAASIQTFIYLAECATVTWGNGRKTRPTRKPRRTSMPIIGRRAFVAGSAA